MLVEEHGVQGHACSDQKLPLEALLFISPKSTPRGDLKEEEQGCWGRHGSCRGAWWLGVVTAAACRDAADRLSDLVEADRAPCPSKTWRCDQVTHNRTTNDSTCEHCWFIPSRPFSTRRAFLCFVPCVFFFTWLRIATISGSPGEQFCSCSRGAVGLGSPCTSLGLSRTQPAY